MSVLSSGGAASEVAAAPARRRHAATPFHCPFCGDDDLRPSEDDAAAWECRSCVRVFIVHLVRIDYAAIPAHRPDEGPLERGGL